MVDALLPSLRIKSMQERFLFAFLILLCLEKVILCPILLIAFRKYLQFPLFFCKPQKLSFVPNDFTSFLSNLYHTITCGSAKMLNSKPILLTTFVSDVFDPLSTDVMKDIQEHDIKTKRLTYTD